MQEKQPGDSCGILVLVRTPLNDTRTRLLRKMLSNPENSVVFLAPGIAWEEHPKERIFRLDDNGFSWTEVYDLVRRSPRILTLS